MIVFIRKFFHVITPKENTMNHKLPGPNSKRIINAMKKYAYDSTFVYP
ncbi:hypothetical protein DYY67_0967 [Candidatus Nitrosotalea sp. TS]|nr:hypothetical protein [Candidatus Nitrosotalea sp. TS]NHI03897.1 hypothetical protein [Candidatus Nitrosotalea sp. TS]